MIPRPSAAQLLEQCRRELQEVVMPQITDDTTLVALDQIQMILANCAHRSETEVADLVAETDEMLRFVTSALGAHSEGMGRTLAAMDAVQANHSSALLTSEVAANHELACVAFSCAVEDLMDVGDDGRVDQAVSWMANERHNRELAGMADWHMPGRG